MKVPDIQKAVLNIFKAPDLRFRSIHYVGYRLLGDFPSKRFPLSDSVRKSLRVAKIRISHVVYISSMMFFMLIAIVAAAVISFPFMLTLSVLGLVSELWFLYALGMTLGSGGIVLAIFLYYPRYRSGSIKTALDKNIVYIINYMSILAGAGVTTESIFTSLAEKGETYKVQESAKSIVRDIEILGKDIIEAVDDESAHNPSKQFSKLLRGINGITRTGGNLQRYLRETATRYMDTRRRELTKLVNQLNLAAEAYVILGIAFPVILTTLLSMMGVFGGEVIGGLGPIEIMTLMTYVFFPLAAGAVILLIDGMTSSW
ncbi:MAG: type II secretion system F family protein [Candidatus Bathyarchaeota archaeon]|nr:MAG: type II secretion system F family protein [Candidatus Bathyarchaeota archaeon]